MIDLQKSVVQQLERLNAEQIRLKTSQTALQQSLSEAVAQGAKVGGAGLTPRDRDTLNQTSVTVSELDKRMGALEGAILQSPEKAVSLPLLKQQLADLQDKTRGDIDGVRGEITRFYTTLQWLLGLMITIIIGVGSLIVNSLRQPGEKRRSGADYAAPAPAGKL